MKTLLSLMLVAATAFPLYGCESNDGGLEELGEDVDRALEDTADGIEDAADDVGDGIEDACEDATDSNC